MKKTRLIEEERKVIVNAILNRDNNARVYLFGSRTDINRMGGDIDILVISDILKKRDIIEIENEIFKKIEEQKIDFLISRNKITDTFIKMIAGKGILIS